ncbi:MAG: TRAP transporter small permease [Betaproteobacteria bacterium]|nr:MAG: TRAP transporter small permease [Betaproteobacteria bacterium]TAG47734.1 MAG: TRAP transporter small permease [Betaproteobacteria bacterium]
MRKKLDQLYDVSAWIAAAFMIALLVMVLLSILGRQFSFHVRGTDAYAGYMMAGAGFFALAHTLKRGEHIRVTLLLQALGPVMKRRLEIFALASAVLLSGLLAWFSASLCWQSYSIHDISTGSDATPLWIPQISMALGTLVLLIAFVDELVSEIRGTRALAAGDDSLHNE